MLAGTTMAEDKATSARVLQLKSDAAEQHVTAAQADSITRDEIANHIGDMLEELRDLAKSGDMATLAMMLDMAAREAARSRSSA
jgi:hypothetical protein